MEAKELRIGNYVSDQVNRHGKVMLVSYLNCVVKLEFSKLRCESNNLFPILLTEYWLLKFGFKKSKHWYTKGKIAISTDLNRLTQKVDGMYVEFYNQFKCPEYVHQLQNLYFALTGEELTIKSNTNDKA